VFNAHLRASFLENFKTEGVRCPRKAWFHDKKHIISGFAWFKPASDLVGQHIEALVADTEISFLIVVEVARSFANGKSKRAGGRVFDPYGDARILPDSRLVRLLGVEPLNALAEGAEPGQEEDSNYNPALHTHTYSRENVGQRSPIVKGIAQKKR
jgi:hypothetical protein